MVNWKGKKSQSQRQSPGQSQRQRQIYSHFTRRTEPPLASYRHLSQKRRGGRESCSTNRRIRDTDTTKVEDPVFCANSLTNETPDRLRSSEATQRGTPGLNSKRYQLSQNQISRREERGDPWTNF